MWAPHAEQVALHLRDDVVVRQHQERGWHAAAAPAAHGDRYGFTLDGGPVRPDPASRSQPAGVHERSALVDPRRFRWSPGERDWRPPPVAAGAVYELHVGTFTAEGTFAAAAGHLQELRELGVTHVEVMPVNAFNGPRGWGYDGVDLYDTTRDGEAASIALPDDLLPGDGLVELFVRPLGDGVLVGSRNTSVTYHVTEDGVVQRVPGAALDADVVR